MKSYRIYLSLILILTLFTAQAQDSFYEKESMKVHPKRVQLVVHMQGMLTPIATRLNGSALFSESPRNLNPGYELTLGTNYNDKLEISGGIRRISLYTGYTFRPFSSSNQDGFMTYATFKSYWQLPIQLKISLWKPTSKLSVWLTTGGAIAREADGIKFSGGTRVKSIIYSANKTPKTLIELTKTKNSPRFLSGEVGLIGRWSISKRIGIDIGVKRNFSNKGLLTFDTTIKDDFDKEDTTTGQAGLNTFSYSAGLSFRIKR